VVSWVLTDRATEFCGKPEHHEYELYLAIENIDHTRTKARSPLLHMRLAERLAGSPLSPIFALGGVVGFPRWLSMSASRIFLRTRARAAGPRLLRTAAEGRVRSRSPTDERAS
jgi:hypothetical protein